jgi:4-amino-4-deoxy-L-arabinose transferase-like glycosyltransferase
MNEPSHTRLHILVLLIVCYFLFFFRIGARDLWNPDEPRYAQVAREMLTTGEWVVPHLNGEIYQEKPPLYFWLVALISKPIGDVMEATARVPSAAAATMVVLITYLLGAKLLGSREAFMGAIATGTSAQFLWIGRDGVLDMLLTLSVVAVLACFCLGYAKRRPLLYVAGFAFLVPGSLTKGPVGIAVPVLVMLVFLLAELAMRKEGAKNQLGWFLAATLVGLVIIAAVVGPWWHAAYERSGGTYGSMQILAKQTGGRIFESYSHRRPFYYFFHEVLWQFLPWTVFFPLAGYMLVRKENLRENQGLRFLLIWFLTVFLFFTLISGKRSQYILPLVPAGGLILGWALMKSNPEAGTLRERKAFAVPFLLLLVAVVTCLIALPVGVYLYAREFLWVSIIGGGVSIAGVLVLAWFCMRRSPVVALGCAAGITVFAAVLTFGYLSQIGDNYKSARPFCNEVLAAMNEDDGVFFFTFYRPNIHYYMGRQMPVLVDQEDIGRALGEYPRIFVVTESDSVETLGWLVRAPGMKHVSRRKIGGRDAVCVAITSAKTP